MSDPVSGDALQKAAKVAQEQAQQQDGLKQGGQQFEQVLDKVETQGGQNPAQADSVRQTLQTDFNTQVQQMPQDERMKVETEFHNKVDKMERPDQARFYATKIDEANRGLVKVEKGCQQLGPSPAKNNLIERLEDMRAHYGDMDKFMNEFAGGKNFSQAELLSVQMRMHQLTQSVELLGKTVEQTTSGMKTIFQTNV